MKKSLDRRSFLKRTATVPTRPLSRFPGNTSEYPVLVRNRDGYPFRREIQDRDATRYSRPVWRGAGIRSRGCGYSGSRVIEVCYTCQPDSNWKVRPPRKKKSAAMKKAT